MSSYNGLTEAQEERLHLLVEEMGEALQAAGKILRHGHSPASMYDNKGDLETELGHVTYAVTLLAHSGDITNNCVLQHTEVKAAEIGNYLHHQPQELIDGLQKSIKAV